jgi:nucleotide-sensitive chloride channel 1A
MEVLREAPKPSSFIPLIEHQSSTPASFYNGPPVLHYYSDRSKLVVQEHEAHSSPALAPLLEASAPQPDHDPEASTTNGTSNGDVAGKQRVVFELDVYVTSDKLLLYQSGANVGLSIPYPSISLHAIQSVPSPGPGEQQGLYMQVLIKSPEAGEGDEPESISITIVPTASAPPQITSTGTGTTETGLEGEDEKEQTPALAMFNALSACSNLHPDPVEPGDYDENEDTGADGSRLFRAGLAFPGASDGGLPPAMPGSGGWITAENMHEFVDEEGNWIGGDDQEEGEGEGEYEDEDGQEWNGNDGGDGYGDGPLGPGAGTVRPRDSDQQGNEDDDDTKWRRTD